MIRIQCCDIITEFTHAQLFAAFTIKNSDIGAKASRNNGGITAGITRTDNHHMTTMSCRQATEQDAVATVLALQQGGANLYCHTPCHITHRRKQRQLFIDHHGFEGDCCQAGLEQVFGQLRDSGQVQVGEQNMIRPQQGVLCHDRLLYLDDQG